MVAGGALASSKHRGHSFGPDVAAAGALFIHFPLREVIAPPAHEVMASSHYSQEKSSIPLHRSLVASVLTLLGISLVPSHCRMGDSQCIHPNPSAAHLGLSKSTAANIPHSDIVKQHLTIQQMLPKPHISLWETGKPGG